jgi:hypothetical protein
MIVNNTITANIASAAHNGGGGVYSSSSSPTIVNNIIAFNSSGVVGYGSPTLRHNCVYGNLEFDYSGMVDPTGTNGNISADPLFADPRYGNWHIQPASPCVNAGDNDAPVGDSDMDGQSRIIGKEVDIGADESDGTVWPQGPYVIVRVSPDGDDANHGASWLLPKRTVQAAVDTASVLGGDVWVKEGTYYERIGLRPYTHVYGGFNGTEAERDERDWSVNATVLDGQQQGSVVTASNGYGLNSTIDGFTIRNGTGTMFAEAFAGGGLFLRYSSVMIANNTITENRADVGGGIYCDRNYSTVIVNSAITDNLALLAYGGGIWFYESSPIIANTTISGNRATGGYGYGGGIACYMSALTAVNTIVTGNHASSDGGGGWFGNSSATLVNNTIAGNSASTDGGAISYVSSFSTTADSIIAYNSSGIRQNGGIATLRHNCVYGNTAYDYLGLEDPTGTDGNISADPLFVQPGDPGPDGQWGTADDTYGDLRLQPNSPCIDGGDNAAVPADTADLDSDGDTTEPTPIDLGGVPRFIDDPATPDCPQAPGTCGTAPIVDMGAHEYDPQGDYDADGVPNGQDNCPLHYNPAQLDIDGDGIGDVCDSVYINAWRSIRVHGTPGEKLAIDLDPAAGGGTAITEMRRDGIQIIEVDFDHDVSLIVSGVLVAQNLTSGVNTAASNQFLTNAGQTLVAEWPPGTLPDQTCFRFDLTGLIDRLTGDPDCLVKSLCGDTNGDGNTNLADMAFVKSKNGAPVVPDNVRFDVNVDGQINLADMALVKSLNGGSATCP